VLWKIVKILVVDNDEVDRMAVTGTKAAGVQMELSEADDCAKAIAAMQQQWLCLPRLSSTRWRRTELSSAGALFRD